MENLEINYLSTEPVIPASMATLEDVFMQPENKKLLRTFFYLNTTMNQLNLSWFSSRPQRHLVMYINELNLKSNNLISTVTS